MIEHKYKIYRGRNLLLHIQSYMSVKTFIFKFFFVGGTLDNLSPPKHRFVHKVRQ